MSKPTDQTWILNVLEPAGITDDRQMQAAELALSDPQLAASALYLYKTSTTDEEAQWWGALIEDRRDKAAS